MRLRDALLIALTALGACRSKPESRIAVVGAGLSGLTAAWQLQELGYTADLYEASDRLGGRVFSVEGQPGHVNELGGAFINSGHEAIIGLCQELSVPLVRFKPVGTPTPRRVILSGTEYTPAQLFELFAPALVVIDEDWQRIEQERRAGQLDGDQMTPTERRLDALTLDEYLGQCGAPAPIRSLANVLFCSEYGMDTSRLDALHLFELLRYDLEAEQLRLDGGIGDESWTIEGGCSRLVDALARGIGHPAHLEHLLSKVSQRADGWYGLHFETPEGSTTEYYSHVIVTVPLPILGEAIEFDVEGFPAIKRKAFESLQQGQNIKYFLYFREPFWRDAGVPYAELITDRFVVWESTFRQESGIYSLTIYLGGSEAIKGGTESEEGFLDEVLAELRKIYPELDEHLIGGRRGAAWSTLPLFRGSYSGCYLPGQWALSEALEEPRVGRLFFAGEAWSRWQGFMNGAVETGRRAARRVVQDVRRAWRTTPTRQP